MMTTSETAETADNSMDFCLFYFQPQSRFKKVVKAYDKAEKMGYYNLTNIEPHSVIVLKQPIGEFPAGTKLLLLYGDPSFFMRGAAFAGNLKCRGTAEFIPLVEAFNKGVLTPESTEGVDFDSRALTSENEYMKRYPAFNYAVRVLYKHERC